MNICLFQRFEEMNLQHLSRGGINITGFQLLNYTEKPGKTADTQWRTWDWPMRSNHEYKISVRHEQF